MDEIDAEECRVCGRDDESLERRECGHMSCRFCEVKDMDGKAYCQSDCLCEATMGGLDELEKPEDDQE